MSTRSKCQRPDGSRWRAVAVSLRPRDTIMSAIAPRAVESRYSLRLFALWCATVTGASYSCATSTTSPSRSPCSPGSRGVGDPMRLEIVLPRVDDHPHGTQQRDKPRQRRPMLEFRNQQVSGSSPLAGSNRINNLQGFSEIGNCGCVGTM